MAEPTGDEVRRQCDAFRQMFQRLRAEISKVIVGHHEIIDGVLTCLFVGGHALLEGVPGLGKTLLIRTLADALKLEFNRIQFTPDLMPADIIGTNIVMEDPDGKRHFEFQQGPLFAQMILADEINRATPKTQSALLEAMQEHTVTVGGTRYELVEPFFVMATQNPIEQEGTYPLPEAQLDRFFYKLIVGYSSQSELNEILVRTTAGLYPKAEAVIGPDAILAARKLVRRVVVSPTVQDYAVRLVMATHCGEPHAAEAANRFLRWGASPRGAQALILAGKVRALMDGRFNLGFEDIGAVFLPALRHRVILNFEAEAEGVTTDAVLSEILKSVAAATKVTA